MWTENLWGIRCSATVLTAVVLSILGAKARAGVISGSQINWLPSSDYGSNYSAVVAQDSVPPRGTKIWFSYSGTAFSFAATNLDEGSDWYLTNAGDAFSAQTIGADQFPVIVKAIKTIPFFQTQTVNIPLGTFYLGVTTGIGSTNGFPNRNVFGWLELNNTGTELIPIANAVAYGEQGIIIGTTTPVPEPGSLLVFAAGLAVLAANRRPASRRMN